MRKANVKTKTRTHLPIVASLLAMSLLISSCTKQMREIFSWAPAKTNPTSAGSGLVDKDQRDGFTVRVKGNKLVDEHGKTLHLRGVSIMGMEFTAIGGWSVSDPYPSITKSTWPALKEWSINAIRIPLNEASYLGRPCVFPFTGPAFKKAGKIIDPDPGHNYKERLRQVVNQATQEHLYVILDLHTTAPNDAKNATGNIITQCAYELNPLPDADHSLEFWRQVASEYRDYPNVIFELFNNPYIDQWSRFKGDKVAAWKALRDGTTVDSYLPLWSTRESHLWKSAGSQQLIDAIRGTKATNVIVLGGLSRSSDLEQWVAFKPNDPIGQLAASWHAFPPNDSTLDAACYLQPGPWCDDRGYSYAATILTAGYPVVVTEFGEKIQTGKMDSAFIDSLLPRLDSLGISYFGWSFTSNGTTGEYDLIKDTIGTPTPEYGITVKSHYLCLAEKLTSCNVSRPATHFENPPTVTTSNQYTPLGWMPFIAPI